MCVSVCVSVFVFGIRFESARRAQLALHIPGAYNTYFTRSYTNGARLIVTHHHHPHPLPLAHLSLKLYSSNTNAMTTPTARQPHHNQTNTHPPTPHHQRGAAAAHCNRKQIACAHVFSDTHCPPPPVHTSSRSAAHDVGALLCAHVFDYLISQTSAYNTHTLTLEKRKS